MAVLIIISKVLLTASYVTVNVVLALIRAIGVNDH